MDRPAAIRQACGKAKLEVIQHVWHPRSILARMSHVSTRISRECMLQVNCSRGIYGKNSQ